MHRVGWPIDWPVGERVACVFSDRWQVQSPAPRCRCRKLPVFRSDDPQVIRRRLVHRDSQLRNSGCIGSRGRYKLLTHACINCRTGDGLAAGTVDHERHHAASRCASDERHLRHHQERVRFIAAVGRLQQIEPRLQLWRNQLIVIGDKCRRYLKSPTRNKLRLIQDRNLCKFCLTDNSAVPCDRTLTIAKRATSLQRILCAKEIADSVPDFILPVVKLFQPRTFIDVFRSKQPCFGSE